MATHKERLDDHDARLGQVEVALGLKPTEPKKSVLERKYEWAINHKGTSSVLAIILCGVSVLGAYWLNHRTEWWNHDVDERARAVLNEKDGVSETLHRVEQTVNRTEAKLETLEPFIHDVIQHQFDSAAKLSPSALKDRLPTIERLTAVAQNQGVKVGRTALSALGRNLRTVDPKAAGFWPTAAGFINYRSFVLLPVDSKKMSNLPNCTDSDPAPMNVAAVLAPDKITVNRALYQNCQITLDSERDDQRINSFLRMAQTAFITFGHCLVTYRGGKINLDLEWKSFTNVPYALDGKLGEGKVSFSGNSIEFADCLFDFSIPTAPSEQGQALTKSLLAQNTNTLTLPPPPSTH